MGLCREPRTSSRTQVRYHFKDEWKQTITTLPQSKKCPVPRKTSPAPMT
jgi:hypothetical protein